MAKKHSTTQGLLFRTALFEIEFQRWWLYIRIGHHAVFLCRGLSCFD